MRAVVISGNGVEVRQAVPALVARTDIQTQQAGFLMIAQRLLWRYSGGKLVEAVFCFETIRQSRRLTIRQSTATVSPSPNHAP